jgi:hypothetical protein
MEDIQMIDSHKTNERVQQLEKGMTSYFDMMKEETQIVQALESSDTEDESSFALKRLRPRDVMVSQEKGRTLKFKDLIRMENHRIEKMKYENKNYSPVVILKKNV